MAILSNGQKPCNFESHNSITLSFTNNQGLCSNFVECESFLESNSPDILAISEINLNDLLILAISLSGVIFLFYYSYAWSCSLCEGRTSFCLGLISRKLCGFSLFLTGFTSFSVLLFSLYQPHLLSLCMVLFCLYAQCSCYFIKHRWGSLYQPICK